MTSSAKQGKVRCLHIIAKHKNSRNPISRNKAKGLADAVIKARTVDQADEILNGFLAQLKKCNDDEKLDTFKAIAKKESDCGSFAKGGDLGLFAYEQMQEAFSAASFKLKVGEISGIVHSDSGSHIIMRIE